jgi:thiamine biosynthesis lipoprotein ApbE
MAVFTKDWKALGTTVHLITTREDGLARAAAAVRDILTDVDQAYSRFRDDSELSRLNARPGQAVTVGPLLANAIAVAERAANLTDGAVDPTVGRAIRVVGYDDDFARLANDRGPLMLRAQRIPGWQAMRVDLRSRRVALPAGVELDLGSTGKALAVDLAAAAALRMVPDGGVLVSLGGDIASAGQPPPGGWQILVTDDSNTPPDGDGDRITITAGGLATSSTMVRRWHRGDLSMHHLIDPETGLPATSRWRTVTVAAATCVDANTASTAAIIKADRAIAWLERQGLPARLVETDGTIHYIGRWPDPGQVAA